MNVFRPDQIHTVAVVAHSGAGKTSLVDVALFDAGGNTRIGRVEDGTSISDSDPEEIRRRMSISLSVVPVEWQGRKLNLLDTPGYADLVGDVMCGLRAADAALFVVSSEKGVEVGTELTWAYANEHELPRLVFINKLDRENASYDRALESLRTHFGPRVVPLTIPIGESAGLAGIVDLVSGAATMLSGERLSAEQVPSEVRQAVERYREQLVECAVEADDDLTTKYLEGEPISEEELRRAIALGVAGRTLVPVLAGSAAKNLGVAQLLDALAEYTPSAAERSGANAEGTPVAYVFKTVVDPQKGTYAFVRVCSGTLKPDTHLYNVRTSTDERLGQLLMMRGKQQEPVTAVPAGDICALVRLAKTHTGDTLGAKDTPELPAIHFPPACYTAAVTPKTQSDLDKLSTALSRMTEEDPTLHVSRDPVTAETLLAGMGESHLDIAIERMQRRYGVEVTKHDMTVPYRETIRKKARAEGRHKKQTGGHGQFADVWLEVEPLPEGGQAYVFENRIVGGVVPKEYVPGVEKGVVDSLKRGVLAGFPMGGLKVALVDGKYHDVDSSAQAFETAAHIGMREVVAQAQPTLLEPILNVSIIVPEAHMGDISADLNTKRGRILGMEPTEDGMQRITAQVPMAEMLHYATDLRSITQGRGRFSTELAAYEEVPAHIQTQIIEAHKKREAAAH